jgi:hypothetical protein
MSGTRTAGRRARAIRPELQCILESRALLSPAPITGKFSNHYNDESTTVPIGGGSQQFTNQPDSGTITVSFGIASKGSQLDFLSGNVVVTGYPEGTISAPISDSSTEDTYPQYAGHEPITIRAHSETADSVININLYGTIERKKIIVSSYNVDDITNTERSYTHSSGGLELIADGATVPKRRELLKGRVVNDGEDWNDIEPGVPVWVRWHDQIYNGPLTDIENKLVGDFPGPAGYAVNARYRVYPSGRLQVIQVGTTGDNIPAGLPISQYNAIVKQLTAKRKAFRAEVSKALSALSNTVGQPGGLPDWPANSKYAWVEYDVEFSVNYPGIQSRKGDTLTE